MYIILLLIYATKGIRGRTTIFDLILDVVILTATVVTTQLALQGETCNGDVGVMGAGLNIVRYSSLLSVMKIVVTTIYAILDFFFSS